MKFGKQKCSFTNIRRIKSKAGADLLFADLHTAQTHFPVLLDDATLNIEPFTFYEIQGTLLSSVFNNRLSLSLQDVTITKV